MTQRLDRRSFLKASAIMGAAGGFNALSWSRVFGANERLRVASIGTGGKGWSDLMGVAASPKVDVFALCDIDSTAQHLGRAAEKFPQAKKFSDWRRLLDEEKAIDGVIVSTPDHMHAPIAIPAMHRRKHVFCQKPLTHTVFEARQMQTLAQKNQLVTQMGNQIQSHEFYRTAVQLVHDGAIGKVRAVHSWQSGKMGWRLVDDRPAGEDPIPESVKWDDWLGVAAARPYKEKIYHSFNWRAWQDYSNGQLGDFGCHILDPVFMALKLTAPLKIKADAPEMNREVWPLWSTVHYVFPKTEFTAGETLNVTWYDGDGRKPTHADLGLPATYALPGSGSVLIGEKGSLVIPHVAAPKLFPEEKFADFKQPTPGHRDHYVQWADACRGEGQATSHFGYSANLTETVLLGTIAIRRRGEELAWNSADLKITNSAAANALLTKPYRKGWEPQWI